MKPIRSKLINGNRYKLLIKENNLKNYIHKPKNIITDPNLFNNKENKSNNLAKTSFEFYNTKINKQSKTKKVKFAKTISDSSELSTQKKFILSQINNNKTISNTSKQKDKEKEIFPYLNLTRTNNKPNPNINIFQQTNNYNSLQDLSSIKNINFKNNDRISNMKTLFSKKETNANNSNNNNKEGFQKDIKAIDENKYKYSIILKNLDIWDKDHCDLNKNDRNINLFNILLDYYEKNNLIKEKNDILYASNILKTKENVNNIQGDSKQNNKIFMDLIKRRRKEASTILKNNLYKAQLRMTELFDKKYQKEFDENLDIDSDTFNLLLEDEMKNIFYNQIIKDRMKYEKQLHDDLLKINNIIYEKKNLKDEKSSKIKQLYLDLAKLKTEYNEKYTKNRKSYWFRYDNYQHYYKSLLNSNNRHGNKEENEDDKEDNNDEENLGALYFQSYKNVNKKIIASRRLSMSPSPRKMRKKHLDPIPHKSINNKENLKRIEDEKNFKLLLMNNEMNSKLKEITDNYTNRMDKIKNEQQQLEKDVKILKLEINYYKKINDELFREHKIYYMNKLKKGYDCRKEGLTWIVYNLLELQIPLEYHHFPKYLNHEQIDYLKKYAKMQLKQDELKIIINVLKKKQNTQKMNDVLKCMDVIDNIIDLDIKGNNTELNEDPELNRKEFLIMKNKIDKKFIKIYQENIDVMKNYLMKDVETYEFHKIINEFKKDLYHGSNSDINKSKRNVLNVFMGDSNNKNYFNFLVDIKTNFQKLEIEKEKLFQNQKKNYLKLVETSKGHKSSIVSIVKIEMIKRCLFGTKLD